MKGLATKILVMLAFAAPAAFSFSAAAQSQHPVKSPARDSLWVRMVSDSTLILLPEPDSAASQSELTAHERAYLSMVDSIALARRIADSLLMRQDSILRAQQRADSLRVARQDSLNRLAARVDELVEKGNDYSDRYYFAKAYESFLEAEKLCSDREFKAIIAERRRQADYARTHTQKVPDLNVVARALFSADDFFLYYPLPDKSWRPVAGAPAVYYTGDETELHLSRDSSLDMYYPMVDGNRMYFASKNLPGFGGLDLYYSDWDERLGEWGEPHNMGFPYSSPFDDFLFVRTEDGQYSVFASTRGLGPDGEDVHVYVVRNTETPAYRAVAKPKDLAKIAELAPVKDNRTIESSADGLQSRYQAAADKEQELRRRLDAVSPEERPTIQAELDAVLAEKASLEEQILSERAASREISESDIVTAGVEGTFPFTKKSYGPRIKIIFDE